MPASKVRASTILGELEQAETELVGKAVILTDGKAGTVESVWLDEIHGLRLSIGGHHGKWPVSTIKFSQPGLIFCGAGLTVSLLFASYRSGFERGVFLSIRGADLNPRLYCVSVVGFMG